MKSSFVFVVLVSAVLQYVNASAIPVWELLKKEEKMSFIYSIFAKEVDKICEVETSTTCSKDLLKYGLHMLKSMSLEQLDAMDPYQRGANNLIWETIMSGHDLEKTTPKQKSSTTAKPNSYEDESLGFDSQEEESAKIENIYKVVPPKDFVFQVEKDAPIMMQIYKVISFLNHFDERKSVEEKIPPQEQVYAEDEDLKQYQITKMKLPNL